MRLPHRWLGYMKEIAVKTVMIACALTIVTLLLGRSSNGQSTEDSFDDIVNRFVDRYSRTKSDEWIARGDDYRRLKNYNSAIVCYDEALQYDHTSSEALLARSVCLWVVGRTAEALRDCDSCIVYGQEGPKPWYLHGRLLDDLGRYEEAVSSFDSALNRDRGDPETWNSRAAALRMLKRHEEAVASWDSASARGNLRAASWKCRGLSLLALDRREEALASFDSTLARQLDLIDAWRFRILILEAMQRYDEAVASYDSALANGADSVRYLYDRETLLFDAGRFSEVLAGLDSECCHSQKYDADKCFMRAKSLERLGQYDDAATCADSILNNRSWSRQSDACELRLVIALRKAEDLAASKEYQKVLAELDNQSLRTLECFNDSLYMLHARALIETQRYDEAIACLDTILVHQCNRETFLEATALYNQRGLYDFGLKACRLAAGCGITNLEAYQELADQYDRIGEPAEAGSIRELISRMRATSTTPPFDFGFYLLDSSRVRLDLFNVVGQRVIKLMDTTLVAGLHLTTWDGIDTTGSPVASGVYFYILDINERRCTSKITLLR
jgi:tetratricopeptide (TPR) repeat protein